MPKRITSLTEAQKAAMAPFAQKWIDRGWRTTPLTDDEWRTQHDGLRRCYEYAGIPWHGNVVRVTSPIVGAFAAPIAAYLLAIQNAVSDAVNGAVNDAVHGAINGAVNDAVSGAVDAAVDDAVDAAVDVAVRGAVRGAVGDAVNGAVNAAVHVAVNGAVNDAVRGAVNDAVSGAVNVAVNDAVSGAVNVAVNDAVRVAVNGAVRGAVRGAVNDAVHGAVGDAVDAAVGDAINGAVGGAVSGAVNDAVGGAVGGAINGAVHGAVDAAVGVAVGGAVGDAVGGAVNGAINGAVNGAVRGAVGVAVNAAVNDAVDAAVDGAVGDAVDAAVNVAVGVAVDVAVGDAVNGAVGDAVRGAVNGAVNAAVRGAVNDAVSGAVGDAVHKLYYHRFCGIHWGAWWNAYVAYFRDIAELQLDGDLWDRSRAFDDAQSAGWWWPFRDFVMVCDVPTVLHLEQVRPTGWGSHRLHCEDGPAVAWEDGWGVYAWHGTPVPADLIAGEWDTARILKEPNAEIRRCAIERMGWDRFIADAQLQMVGDPVIDPGNPGYEAGTLESWLAKVTRGHLGRKTIPAGTLALYDVPEQIYDADVRVLLCSNATPERDGTRRQFGLTVPSHLTDPVDAASWTFGLTADEYKTLERAT